jgi:hypothetical protein
MIAKKNKIILLNFPINVSTFVTIRSFFNWYLTVSGQLQMKVY